jgi:hypothetical protein
MQARLTLRTFPGRVAAIFIALLATFAVGGSVRKGVIGSESTTRERFE